MRKEKENGGRKKKGMMKGCEWGKEEEEGDGGKCGGGWKRRKGMEGKCKREKEREGGRGERKSRGKGWEGKEDGQIQ